jgi:secreted PhoX family phosphatase
MLAPAGTFAAEETNGVIRFATVPLRAEVTGLYITENGDLFYKAQHPAHSNMEPNDLATVGVLEGVNMYELKREFEPVKVPERPTRSRASSMPWASTSRSSARVISRGRSGAASAR